MASAVVGVQGRKGSPGTSQEQLRVRLVEARDCSDGYSLSLHDSIKLSNSYPFYMVCHCLSLLDKGLAQKNSNLKTPRCTRNICLGEKGHSRVNRELQELRQPAWLTVPSQCSLHRNDTHLPPMLCDTQTIGLSPTPAARSFWRSSLLLNAMDFLNKMKTAGMTGGYWLPQSLLSSSKARTFVYWTSTTCYIWSQEYPYSLCSPSAIAHCPFLT